MTPEVSMATGGLVLFVSGFLFALCIHDNGKFTKISLVFVAMMIVGFSSLCIALWLTEIRQCSEETQLGYRDALDGLSNDIRHIEGRSNKPYTEGWIKGFKERQVRLGNK